MTQPVLQGRYAPGICWLRLRWLHVLLQLHALALVRKSLVGPATRHMGDDIGMSCMRTEPVSRNKLNDFDISNAQKEVGRTSSSRASSEDIVLGVLCSVAIMV